MWRVSLVFCVSVVLAMGNPHSQSKVDSMSVQDSTQDNRVSEVNTANREFAFRLYSALTSQPDFQDKNIFFSPVSVSVALAAMSVGARGETHKQLFTGLGFNSSVLSQPQVNQAFQVLLNKATSQDTTQGTAVFVDDKFKPKPEFLETLKHSYLTDGFTVDFSNSTETVETINTYVSEKTHGRIEKMVESLPEETVMYLLSYIFFKGQWQDPFDGDLTKEDTFDVDKNTKVPVQMMEKENDFLIYYDLAIGTSVLQLHFNTSTSMLLMLPADMATLEKAISPSRVSKWLQRRNPKNYIVHLPKFSIKTSYSLKSVLSEMGMTEMFGGGADLSGIAERLVVGEVAHKAALTIHENGATASAATGMFFYFRSLVFFGPPVLKFNKPFMVLILDRETQDILFMGKIINPNM